GVGGGGAGTRRAAAASGAGAGNADRVAGGGRRIDRAVLDRSGDVADGAVRGPRVGRIRPAGAERLRGAVLGRGGLGGGGDDGPRAADFRQRRHHLRASGAGPGPGRGAGLGAGVSGGGVPGGIFLPRLRADHADAGSGILAGGDSALNCLRGGAREQSRRDAAGIVRGGPGRAIFLLHLAADRQPVVRGGDARGLGFLRELRLRRARQRAGDARAAAGAAASRLALDHRGDGGAGGERLGAGGGGGAVRDLGGAVSREADG